ncbi:hypothetical protein [Marinobacterium stanieri]|uniref:Uncharacterized protein n=1 Tax=Marinobacterium stanieri TaxID=49186 RepID=A0A1N6U7R4_9GAMM|nr:hypothetical protein [Marinobacterium stanieri]SIQ61541.1 hypothetical protein SAMN05421647_106255 [Marinobacterium stanieri]
MKYNPHKFTGGSADTAAEKLILSVGRAVLMDYGLDTELVEECRKYGLFHIQQYLQHGHNGDFETDSGLTLAEVARLVEAAEGYPRFKQLAQDAKEEADNARTRISEARQIMRSDGKHRDRMAKALSYLGLIGDDHGRGHERVDHQHIASHYYALRMGHHWHENGELVALDAHSHQDAVDVICEAYDIGSWETLRHACKNKGIPLRARAECYPVK